MSRVLPILFNTEMVRAILDGRKTATRRLIKSQPPYDVQCPLGYCTDGYKSEIGKFAFGSHKDGGKMIFCKPPYQPGDILYVRETWGEGYEEGTYIYRADDKLAGLPTFKESSKLIYHPSIHMPKEAARIWLKVTDVRVERLQEITEEQIGREGVEVEYPHVLNGEEKRYAFSTLWNSTVKKSDLDRYGWKANPWVWVIEFERCEKPEGV